MTKVDFLFQCKER